MPGRSGLREATRGGVTLLKPPAQPPEPQDRRFRIVIEGAIDPAGRPAIGRLELQFDPERPVSALEAEAICRRVAFAPPAAAQQAPAQEASS
ncbi:MAG: hypothetical protein KGK07_07470 [Chloroflexota bacterium]|nr:hypothetical protein [Chloroflexota bacterium]